MNTTIHSMADVQSKKIGNGTHIWQYVVILPHAKIGDDCNICSHCFIENDVMIGNRVTVKNGVQLWDGLRIADDVFIGPNVSFSNDRYPRSKNHDNPIMQTVVEHGASLGAGATVLPGLTIGTNSIVGAGAVVTRSVPPNAIVAGNPARIIGYAGTHASHAPAAFNGSTDTAYQSVVKGVSLIPLTKMTDLRGSITVGEFGETVPFEPKRHFVVYDVPSVETRGEHAHKKCHQFLVCVKGSLAVVVDDGLQREEFALSSSSFGLHLPPLIWATEYKYSADAVLLVLASDHYDPDDYIRDYGEFLKTIRWNK